jgi:hypothetical protein
MENKTNLPNGLFTSGVPEHVDKLECLKDVPQHVSVCYCG